MANAKPTQQALKTADRIAREVLDLETLETRKMDSLDFKEQAVWSIKQALLDAYAAGFEAGKTPGGGGRAKK
ncbi:MAG: hypothetical protein R3C45_21050 [Phycisphaerales bacterium]